MLYLLKFSEPLGNERHQAQYYLGWCDGRIDERLKEHRAGRGAAITRAAVERGLKIELVGVIEGTREDERRLKNWKNHSQLVSKFKGAGQ